MIEERIRSMICCRRYGYEDVKQTVVDEKISKSGGTGALSIGSGHLYLVDSGAEALLEGFPEHRRCIDRLTQGIHDIRNTQSWTLSLAIQRTPGSKSKQ